jgi:hypothetical protein
VPDYAPVTAPKSSLPMATNIPQPRDVALPDFTANTYVPFWGQLTGVINAPANFLSVWTPKETRFVLRGGYITIVCSSSCAGIAAATSLSFFDESSIIMPITTYHTTQTLVGWVNAITPWHFDLGKGYKSKAKNNRLMIGGQLPIGTGIFECSGLVWGVQEL